MNLKPLQARNVAFCNSMSYVYHARFLIDLCAANEPRAPSESPDLASKMLAAGFICRATMNKPPLNNLLVYYIPRTSHAYLQKLGPKT